MYSRTSASSRYSRLSRIRAGTPNRNSSTTSHAPSLNLTTMKITTTTSEVTPAEKLITIRRRQADSLTLW